MLQEKDLSAAVQTNAVLLAINNLNIMNKSNRDILVLYNENITTPQSLEHEVEWLHGLLFNVERMDNFASAHEIINLNNYKVYHNKVEIKKYIRRKKEQAFVFLNNRN